MAAAPAAAPAGRPDLLPPGLSPWSEATLAAALLAVDPAGLGGIRLRAGTGPVRDRWMACLAGLMAKAAPVRVCPAGVDDQRLAGGIDLAATLALGRPVIDKGLLAEAAGGLLVLRTAERLSAARAALVAQALDGAGEAGKQDRFAIVLLDEGVEPDEFPPLSLTERTGFHLELDLIAHGDALGQAHTAAETEAARRLLPQVTVPAGLIEALCQVADEMGVASLRATLFAVAAARGLAAFAGRRQAGDADAALAAKLVLLPRATRLPAPEAAPPPPETPPPESGNADRPDDSPAADSGPLADTILEAIAASLPPDLLASLKLGRTRPTAGGRQGRVGEARKSPRRGRSAGVRAGMPGAGIRLALVETLRAAAPWQPLRQRAGGARLAIRAGDIRIRRFVERARTTTVFVVDASGSAALHRLAEAKGAVELMLAECYVRRDEVALIAFRGTAADLLLPPTRSLTRARRSLSALPGGGGTPLAAGLDAARLTAEAVARRGDTPVLVFLTDGKGNIRRDGQPGREVAEAEALQAAAALKAGGAACLLIDAAPRPEPKARRLAEAMGAAYVALPKADAAGMARIAGAGRKLA
jgi:magnesium chelatase subunit D